VDGSVLIAHGNGDLGSRIANACSEHGIRCRVVPHGAAALETALAEIPEVLVVQRDLPLIDGKKLGEILHANPRTQSVRLFFLGDRGGEGETPEAGLQMLSPSVSPEDVAESVRALLDEKEEARPVGEEGDEETSGGVEGVLAQLPLTDLLQLFHVSRKTGVVELERRDGRGHRENGRVLVSRGEVIHAVVGTVEGEKALFRLIGWERGSFAFRPEPVFAEPTIETPTLALLREGRRQVEEWERLAVRLPPMDAHVTLKIQSASLPNVIHPLTQEVLLVLEHYSRVRDVVDRCSYPDYQVLRMLNTLIRRGMLSLRRDVPGPKGTPSRAGLFSPNQASRLREWLNFEGPRGSKRADAKLVVASSSPEACREFARVVIRLPGVESSDAATAGEIPVDEIASLGRIAVDTEVGIEFIHVPVADRFQPLWPVAAQGALGVLLLLAGPLSVAVDAIHRIATEMRNLPRSRVFHLLLLEKGQGVAPEALRENITLLDDTSLFLIPQENDGKAGILLREMFGRILP
jgi:hypothetical protein